MFQNMGGSAIILWRCFKAYGKHFILICRLQITKISTALDMMHQISCCRNVWQFFLFHQFKAEILVMQYKILHNSVHSLRAHFSKYMDHNISYDFRFQPNFPFTRCFSQLQVCINFYAHNILISNA